MANAEDNTQVRVAKITAFQAIIVALITVVGGGIGYFAGTSGPGEAAATPQRWLVIQGVEGPPGVSVRIVASVNSIIYAYPADVPYTKIGPNMAEQKLPLPSDADEYTIGFVAQFKAMTPGGFNQALSRARPTFSSRNLPTDRQQYALRGVIDGEKQVEVAVTVFYSFR